MLSGQHGSSKKYNPYGSSAWPNFRPIAGEGRGVAVDHDVDAVARGFTHRLHRRLGQPNRPQPFDGHRRRDRHGFEGREPVLDSLPGQIAELSRIIHGRFVEVLHPPAAQVAIRPDVIPHGATPQLRTRHSGDLARDIPQRQIDPGDSRGADNPMAVPEMLAVHHLPQMLDPARVLAHHQLGQILHRTHHRPRVPFQRRLAPAVQPRLIGQHLDKHPIPHPGVTD